MLKNNQEIKRLQKELERLKESIIEKDRFCHNSREKFEKALMASHDAVCIMDLETYNILEINNNFEHNFGYSIEELKGKTSGMLKLWANPEDWDRIIYLITKEGRVRDFEAEMKQKNGKNVKTQISAEKIISDKKNCLLVYYKSITKLRKTESYYRLLAENSTDVIWVLGLDERFTYISPSVEKLRGYKPEEVLQQSIAEVMTPSSAQKVKILLKSFKDQEQNGTVLTDSLQTEVEQTCKDGSTVWTEVLVTPIKDGNGNFSEIIGVSRNIKGKRYAEQKARQYTRTIEGIFRSSPIGIGMTKNRIFEMVNNQLCNMLGYSREDIIGHSARIIYASDEEFERVGRVKYAYMASDNKGEIYTQLKTKNGEILDVLMSSSAIEPNDLSKGVVFNILDVSTLNKTKSQLASNEEKYTTFFNNINDAILIHPWQEKGFGKFIEINEFACQLYGYSKEELLSMSVVDIHQKEDIDFYSKKESRSSIKNKGSILIESNHIRKDGTSFHVEISSNIFFIEGRTMVLSIVRDISERLKAQTDISESELKYKKMFESSPEAMLLIEKTGVISDCNASFLEITGKNIEEVMDKHFLKTNLLPEAKLPEYMKIWARLLREKTNQRIDFDWKHKNGNTRKAIGHFAPVLKQNKITGYQALLKDVTHEKEFERNLIIAKERAEENSRLKSAFLETMSHELRTPLNAVIGFSNLIEDETNHDSIMEMNKYVTENGKKLLNIIESIFDISMLETRSAVLKTEEFSVDDIFMELEITVKGMIELEHKPNISTYYQPGSKKHDITITTDKQRLKQLLTNLLINAVRYTDKGSIRYGYSFDNNNIEFFVADTGIGIPRSKLDIIFHKFTQVDSTPTRTRGGLGLGLSIVDEISKLLKGKISVDSEPGKGSTFSFSLKRKQDSGESVDKSGLNLEGKTMLIVEDVESNYLYLEKVLAEAGASVIWAQTGQDAIAIAEKLDKIDLILMDIRMPDIDGYEITRTIKKLRPAIPIIAQTAYAMASDRKEALAAGCSDHISKPIKVDTLLLIVNKHIKAKAMPGLVV